MIEASPEPEKTRRSRSRWTWLAALAGLVALSISLMRWTESGRQFQFLVGGALVNLGYRLQDHLESYDFEHHEDITPEQVWAEVLNQNSLASFVRYEFPRTSRHPLVALVVCMDARLDTNELIGDTRRYYYVLRTAGSVLSEREEEMLELAVENGVKLVVWTTHTDCAAENAASTEAKRLRFPALSKAVDEREMRVAEFLSRPAIASRIADGRLAVKRVIIDTKTEEMKSQ